MAIRSDGNELANVDVPAREDEPEVYEIRAKLDAWERRLSVAFLNDYYNPAGPEKLRGDRHLARDHHSRGHHTACHPGLVGRPRHQPRGTSG